MQSHSSNFMFRRKFTYNLPEKRRNELLLFASYAHLDTITQLSHHFFIFIYFDQLNHKIRLTLATAFMLSIFLAFLLFSLSLRLLTGLKKLFCFRCIIYELYMARVAHLHPVFFVVHFVLLLFSFNLMYWKMDYLCLVFLCVFAFFSRHRFWANENVIFPWILQMLKMKKHEELETPTFTTSIPIDIVE